jgi:hypothetical protein
MMRLFPDTLYQEFMTMARNVNLTISSENDDTTRNNVPDWLIHMTATWIDNQGNPQSLSEDRYFLLQLNWLRINHPQAAKQVMQELVYRIERVRQGMDDAEDLA